MSANAALNITPLANNSANTNTFRLFGRLVSHRDCYEFLDQARDQVSVATPDLTLDMRHVKLINSAGIGILASLIVACRQVGGQLTIAGGSDRLLRSVRAAFPAIFINIVAENDTSEESKMPYESRLYNEHQINDGIMRSERVW